MGLLDAQRQADMLKNKGNLYYKKEKLGAAIDAYTEAITLCPSVPVYWTNRALCERKRNEWEKVEADCRKALELDNQSVKAYYMLGLALMQYKQFEEGIKQLEKALDLGRGATGAYMVEEIWYELAKARFSEWQAISDIRFRQQIDLKSYLEQLLREDYERQLNEAIASIKAAVAFANSRGSSANSHEPVENTKLGLGATGDIEGSVKLNASFNPDVAQLRRIYRTISEPPSIAQEVDELKRTSTFDPLRQHKLSLSLRRGGSLSSRRQKSQILPGVDHGYSAGPVAESRQQLERAGSDIQQEKSTKPNIRQEKSPVADLRNQAEKPNESEINPWVPNEDKSFQPPAVESTSSSSFQQQCSIDESTFHSIYDVFRVFKEFMKFNHHEASQKLLSAIDLYQRRSKLLTDLFETVAAPDKVADVPDHLCCKITMDIFRDPVITTSGITYERAALLDHLRKVGKFDPITRAPLRADQIIPNLAVKEAVQMYLEEHGWAYGPC